MRLQSDFNRCGFRPHNLGGAQENFLRSGLFSTWYLKPVAHPLSVECTAETITLGFRVLNVVHAWVHVCVYDSRPLIVHAWVHDVKTRFTSWLQNSSSLSHSRNLALSLSRALSLSFCNSIRKDSSVIKYGFTCTQTRMTGFTQTRMTAWASCNP